MIHAIDVIAAIIAIGVIYIYINDLIIRTNSLEEEVRKLKRQ